MSDAWCENIKVVHDNLALWPSAFTLSFILAGIGVLWTYRSLKSGEATILWLNGPLLLFGAITHLDFVNNERVQSESLFVDAQRVELIGRVTDQKMVFGSFGHGALTSPIDVKPWKFWHLTHSREQMWLTIDQTRVRTTVGLFTVKPGNRCNGFSCGLEKGDMVRVTSHKSLYHEPPVKDYFEPFFAESLRIERCDD